MGRILLTLRTMVASSLSSVPFVLATKIGKLSSFVGPAAHTIWVFPRANTTGLEVLHVPMCIEHN